MIDKEIKDLSAKADGYSSEIKTLVAEISKVIVGQEYVLERLLISLISDGHVLLEGVPGLAKSLMVKTLSDTINTEFKRIQFTPDLLPADIIGTKIFNMNTGSFTTKKGPIFANFILADEINRAPPKVQSALLEAMQERQVTISGETHPLLKPFLVLATQNPIETEGTYALPEAEVDRFMFKVFVDYPSQREEKKIVGRMTTSGDPRSERIITPQKIMEIQRFNREIYADEKIVQYVTDIVHSTRRPEEYGLDLEGLIDYGASPRASIWLTIGGKAHALLNGRGYVTPEDIKTIAPDVLRHRIILSYEAEAENLTSDDIITKILKTAQVP